MHSLKVSVIFMTKCQFLQMPRIWLDYLHFLIDQGKITRTRRCFDRALRALPVTQHNRIWPLYLKFMRSHDLPETAVRVYRRYLKVTFFICFLDNRRVDCIDTWWQSLSWFIAFPGMYAGKFWCLPSLAAMSGFLISSTMTGSTAGRD